MNDLPPPSPDSLPSGHPEFARPETHVAPRESASRAMVRVAATEASQMRRMRARLAVASIGFGLLFVAIGVKLTDATILSPAASRIAQTPRQPSAEPAVARAAITDRNGEILAVTVRGTALYARPGEIDNPARVADQLVRILPHLDRARLLPRLSPPRQFAYLDRFITPRQEQAIRARIFAERGLLEYVPWEEISAERMRAKIDLLLEQSTVYQQRLQGFAMTALEVIAARLASFGESS